MVADFQAIRFGYQKARAVDEVEKATFKMRPREKISGSTDEAYRRALELIDNSCSRRELVVASDEARQIMAGVAVDEYT